MQKLLLLVMLSISISFTAAAQEHGKKIKKTSSLGQKVHNTFSRHKKHSGYKVKSERNGIEHKHKVNTHEGEVKNKSKKE